MRSQRAKSGRGRSLTQAPAGIDAAHDVVVETYFLSSVTLASFMSLLDWLVKSRVAPCMKSISAFRTSERFSACWSCTQKSDCACIRWETYRARSDAKVNGMSKHMAFHNPAN